MVAAGGGGGEVEGHLVLVERDRRLGEVVGGGGPAVRARGVVDDHDRSLDLPTGTSRLASTLAPSPSHVVALARNRRVVPPSFFPTFCFPPNSASARLGLVHLVPLLTGKMGLAVHRWLLMGGGATALPT